MFAAVLPIAIIGNGLRVATTGWLTTWMGAMAVEGFVHQATGYAAFLVMCGGLFSLLWIGRSSAGGASARRAVDREFVVDPDMRPRESEAL